MKNIEELIISFRNSQIKEMMDFGNTLVKWKYEIVNSFVPANGRRISNGLIENRNKSIKLLKHSSNGTSTGIVSRQESCTVSIKTQHITCIQSKTRGILQSDDKKKDLYTDCGQS